jgi:hypothetical protein
MGVADDGDDSVCNGKVIKSLFNVVFSFAVARYTIIFYAERANKPATKKSAEKVILFREVLGLMAMGNQDTLAFVQKHQRLHDAVVPIAILFPEQIIVVIADQLEKCRPACELAEDCVEIFPALSYSLKGVFKKFFHIAV